MWLSSLLIIFATISSCFADVDISEAKNWIIKVRESGFKIKVCLNGHTGKTHICYQGNPKNDQKHGCPDNFCGILVTRMAGATSRYSYQLGAGFGETNLDCFEVDVTPTKLEVRGSDKIGTCKLKTGWDGKLLFNMLTLIDGTIHLENADWWKGKDDTGKANVNVIIFSNLDERSQNGRR
uniref:Uncharacterized protein n=1 Tax=Panagrolaimus sp. JU765 TaxID=591449 RepID=A0AC34PZA4_9BILA